ncbi:hypothetical protein, partial [Rubellimicrobium arenae]|uniref:hypothetical protein n=1 Tax=Rubellimicrobium arenae TaxID=2817372 RepID=UPI001B3005E9
TRARGQARRPKPGPARDRTRPGRAAQGGGPPRLPSMIVYSDRERSEDPKALVSALLGGLALRSATPDVLPDRLIEAGLLESAVTDALSPDRDEEPPLARQLRAVTLDLAHAVRGGSGTEARIDAARARLAVIASGPLPDVVAVSEPEGFAFYALYPELYAQAARQFLQATGPERALVIGLRNIGTTLSAVVAAELEAAGLPVRTFTVRPRAHPFERELRLGPRLLQAMEDGAPGHVLVVDEGPGISGSSFACVAEAALRAGVPEARLALFPSWDTDGAGIRSDKARALWPRLSRWTASFERKFLDTGRLSEPWGGGALRDMSGGLWRDLLCPPDRRPAVQPQHERRKYLLGGERTPLLLKFAGLGSRGRRARIRAERQAEAGLAPAVEGLSNGFLALRFVPGQPLQASDLDAGLLDVMGRYLGHLVDGGADGVPRFEDLLHMTRVNVTEALGPEAAARTAWMDRLRDAVLARPTVAGDGRMLPQEWLRTPEGILKTDGIDHHDDHFWPGAQDIAWDLAGATIEWGMDPAAQGALIEGYVARTRDAGVREVLPFYRTAYLAWRLGYTSLAAETLGQGDDADSLRRDRDRYAALLRRDLAPEGIA